MHQMLQNRLARKLKSDSNTKANELKLQTCAAGCVVLCAQDGQVHSLSHTHSHTPTHKVATRNPRRHTRTLKFVSL